jgi:hypothetical protein
MHIERMLALTSELVARNVDLSFMDAAFGGRYWAWSTQTARRSHRGKHHVQYPQGRMDWSVNQGGARIINMSFVGPKDPSLKRAQGGLRQRHRSGCHRRHSGPKSPALFPEAYP